MKVERTINTEETVWFDDLDIGEAFYEAGMDTLFIRISEPRDAAVRLTDGEILYFNTDDDVKRAKAKIIWE